MTKTEAIALFGNTPAEGIKALAEALGKHRQAIYQWPETLTQGIADQVIGAAYRVGKLKRSKPKKRA